MVVVAAGVVVLLPSASDIILHIGLLFIMDGTDTGLKSPYEVLGVSRSASKEEIKSAYRKLCKQYHPDMHTPAGGVQGDTVRRVQLEKNFKEISAAYTALTKQQSGYRYAAAAAAASRSGSSGGRHIHSFSNGALAAVIVVPLAMVGFMLQLKRDEIKRDGLDSEMKIRPHGFWVPPYNPYLRDDLQPITRESKWPWS